MTVVKFYLDNYQHIGCIRVLRESAKLRKSAAEKRDPKKHLSLSVAVRDWSVRTEFRHRK